MSQLPSRPGQPPAKPPLNKRSWLIVVPSLIAVGLVASACGGTDGGSGEAAASSTPTAPAAPPATAAPSTAVPPPASATSVNFAMPNLVGTDLQTAQNQVQTYGPFLSLSHDLLGSRNQVIDSNWIVCDQNIPPGQQVTGDVEGKIDFGVVKREESCP